MDGSPNERGAQPAVAQQSPMPETVVCWNCAGEIPVRCAGSCCPLCGADLSEQAYDNEAERLLKKGTCMESEIAEVSEQLSRAKMRNARLGPLRNIPFFPSRRIIDRLESSLAEMRQEHRGIDRLLDRLAVARYYSSRWHKLTGTPLCNPGDPRSSAFGSPRYALQHNGTVSFSCKASKPPQKHNSSVEARYAEYETFCELQRIVDSGMLGHARLLANLLVTYDNDDGQRYNKRIRANEIDAVLVTERTIIVIETKLTSMAITASFDSKRRRHRITRTRIDESGNLSGTAQDDRAAGQLFAHCCTLSNTGIFSIGLQSLAGVVAYAAAPRLTIRCRQGEGEPPVYIASLGKDGPSLEEALLDAVFSHKVERSADEVDVVADELFARYSDLDGSKLRAHRQRIAHEAALRSAPATAQKRKRHNPRKRDAGLERMLREIRLARRS